VADQSVGVLELTVRQPVLGIVPPGGHSQPPALSLGQFEQRLKDVGQQRVATLEHRQHHPDQERAHFELPGPDADRQQRLDPLRHAGSVDDPLDALKPGAHILPPRSATSSCSEQAGS
jgi:hypothetical protein